MFKPEEYESGNHKNKINRKADKRFILILPTGNNGTCTYPEQGGRETVSRIPDRECMDKPFIERWKEFEIVGERTTYQIA